MENIESFRSFLLGSFPELKLPKGKKVVELSLGRGILMCCMVRKDGVMVFLYSGGRIPADEIFSKLNSLGVTGRVINNKYKINPLPGSRNPNIVRIDLLVPFENRDLNNQDLRNEVLDVYNQLIDLCMPLNPDAVVQKETEDNDSIKTYDEKITSNNEIKISCEGDGFRYEYLEDGSQKLISKCSGPLAHNLKIKITSDGKNNEFSIKDISCNETYDKIINSEFEEYLEKNDMFEIPTTLYQFRQNGTYFFDALILDDDENFDINRLEAELIIPVGDLFKQPGLKHFIYGKNNGEKVKIKIQDGQYNETNWDPVESNYDLEIEHYTEKLTQNQYWHSKIFFNEDPKDFLKDYDDIGHIESVGELVKDKRFKSSFLEKIFEIGFYTWAKKEILDEVLKSFEQNSNCSNELIKVFKERIKSVKTLPKEWNEFHKVASVIFGAYNIAQDERQLKFIHNMILPSFKDIGVDLSTVWEEVHMELKSESSSYKYTLYSLISEISTYIETVKETVFYAVTDLLDISRMEKEPPILTDDEYEYLSICMYYWYADNSKDKNKFDFKTIFSNESKTKVPDINELVNLNPENLNLNRWPALEQIISSLSVEKSDYISNEEATPKKNDLNEDYEGNRKLIEQAKTITETNNGEIDDFLGDENISKDLLELLYDFNIENWVNDRDDFENNWSIGLIISNPQSSKSLLKKVFKHLENTLYEDKEVQFSDLAKNINTKLGDEDWAKKLYHIVEEIVFSNNYIKENGVSKASELALDITTSLKDRSWGRILFEKIEKLEDINKVAFAINLAKSFHDDTGWCKRTYHSILNNEKYTQSSKDLILLAHTIASYDKKNMDISIEIFKKVEKSVIYLSDYIRLAGSVSNKDGLNDVDWSNELFQKGLQQFSATDYVEHPKVKEWELKNEVSKIIGQIKNDYNFPWVTMKDWLKPLEDINNKLASGNSKMDAVKDYLPSSESSETETGEKNKKYLSGKLNIIIEGKMSQCRIGKISHEMKKALKIASENYIDEVSNESELLEMMIRGDFEEISNSIPQSAMDSDCKELKKLLDKDRGEIFEELNIFYEPFVIDDDNKILIKIGDHIVYEGLISQLCEERFELGYDKEKVEYKFKLKISEILKKISFTTIQSETDQLCWSDDISLENQESIIQSFEDGENLSKYGWWLYCVNNLKYENEKNADNWDNRLSIVEYGSFKLDFQQIQVEAFDWLKLIWRVDGDIEEAELTGSEYMFSNILYADENKGIVELEPSIREFDLKDIKCEFHWPGT